MMLSLLIGRSEFISIWQQIVWGDKTDEVSDSKIIEVMTNPF